MLPSRSQFIFTQNLGDSMSQSSYTYADGSPHGSLTLHGKDGSFNETPCSVNLNKNYYNKNF